MKKKAAPLCVNDPTGFRTQSRKTFGYQAAKQRVKHFNEFIVPLKKEEIAKQGQRCMDCGVPFCHTGCPLGNVIPEFNQAVYGANFKQAYQILSSTNNFPDITGRICPAPCESACVLGINQPPVAIKSIEYAIAEEAIKHDWDLTIKAATRPPTGKKVAIVGSGPAGLACADQLQKAGHEVTVFERDDEIGGLLTYGVPNFKLDKKYVFRHVERMKKAGVKFETQVEVGRDLTAAELSRSYEAIVLAIGATRPRDLPLPGRAAKGIHFAMPFLKQATKQLLKRPVVEPPIAVKGKRVVIIGGGDTGLDCMGTSLRHGAAQVTQLEIVAKPPLERDETMPWPQYARVFRMETSHEEGGTRKFSLLTKRFLKNAAGELTGLEITPIEWSADKKKFVESKKSQVIACEVALLAIGFLGPEVALLKQLGVECNARANIKADASTYATSQPGIFTAGDSRRGQSLVVWAISEGRECALAVDAYLSKKRSTLHAKAQSAYQLQ